MRIAVGLTLLALLLGGCQQPREGCGLLGCITTGHVKARGRDLVGADVRQAINVMGGAPDSTYSLDARTQVLTWTRQQNDRSFGLFVCTETLTVASGIVVKHAERGSCG